MPSTKKDEGNLIGMTEVQAIEDLSLDQELLEVGYRVLADQKKETFTSAWHNHWRGAVWSLFVSLALWMEGFDNSMLGSFYGQPAFQDRFGTLVDGKQIIPNPTQVGLSNTATCGQLVGLVITGIFQERVGCRKTFFGGMILMIGTIFIAVFAQNLNMLYAAEFCMGIPWGMFQTLTTAYASEICPVSMRGYLSAWAQMCWSGGKFISTGVLRGTLKMHGSWSWRLPYALQWMWPLPLAALIVFAPESPWWLVRKGRFEEAKQSVRRCTRPGLYTEGEIAGYIEYMAHTDALDRAEQAKGSFTDMFKGTNLRRTEIQIGTWMAQIWNGNAITNLSVQLFEKAGLSTTIAFNFTLILNGISTVGVATSWVLLRWTGRRTIYATGLALIICCNFLIGVLGFTTSGDAPARAVGSIMVILNYIFTASMGPVCYTICGELPASRLRAQSIAFGRFIYVINAIIGSSITPYTTNDWGTKSGLFWMGCGLVCFVWVFFRLPETGGFSFAELDILFANKVSARKFKSTTINERIAFHTKDTVADGPVPDDDAKEIAMHEENIKRTPVLEI